MKLTISDKAAEWYKTELNLNDGDGIRFFARYGGHSPVQKGFSLGISQESPSTSSVKTEGLGITFFINEDDLWYFDDHDLEIEFNEKIEEPEFKYQ